VLILLHTSDSTKHLTNVSANYLSVIVQSSRFLSVVLQCLVLKPAPLYVTDGRTDGQTDGQNCYINIARQCADAR